MFKHILKFFILYTAVLFGSQEILAEENNTAGGNSLIISSTGSQNTSGSKSEQTYLDADVAFVPTLEQDGNHITIKFTIASDYYLYQERFKVTPVNCRLVDLKIPEGIYHDDEYMGPSHIYFNEVILEATVAETELFPKIAVQFQGCTAGMCYPPVEKKLAIDRLEENGDYAAAGTYSTETTADVSQSKTSDSSSAEDSAPVAEYSGLSEFDSIISAGEDSTGIYEKIGKSFAIGIIAFFVFGIILSLTPCMFPMYPIWSAIILGNKKKNLKTSLIYTVSYILGMATAYMLAGFCIAYAGASFQMFLQKTEVLIAISLIFFILALSMFGLFNVSLPSSWINKLQQINDHQKGGTFIGVFVMGVISAIIASPCTTAPLAGALMFIMKDGDIIRGGLYLFIMGLGMGVPLAIIGILGPKFLPNSGMWMKNIKILCGFILLTVPLYLLRSQLTTGIITAVGILMCGSLMCYIGSLVIKKQRIAFIITSVLITMAIAGYSLTLTGEHRESFFSEVKNIAELNSVLNSEKIVIMDIRADWCASCIKYEKTTFADKQVADFMKQYKNIYVDISDADAPSKSIIEKYKKAITGVPSILIFKEGKLVYTINGYLDSEKFINRIKKAVN
ncbi:MAG: protein-disulfide reductase DsbD [Ruminobacter sp.]|nr:protein-disulfide reductase DsbD [Ruminobacter sp.]